MELVVRSDMPLKYHHGSTRMDTDRAFHGLAGLAHNLRTVVKLIKPVPAGCARPNSSGVIAGCRGHAAGPQAPARQRKRKSCDLPAHHQLIHPGSALAVRKAAEVSARVDAVQR